MKLTFDSTLPSRFQTFSRVEYSRKISLEGEKVFAYIFSQHFFLEIIFRKAVLVLMVKM